MDDMEVELDDRVLVISAKRLRHVQAVWRGAVSRKQLLSLRADYEQVVRETELPGLSLQLSWPADPTGRPQFTKSSQPGLTVTSAEPKTGFKGVCKDENARNNSKKNTNTLELSKNVETQCLQGNTNAIKETDNGFIEQDAEVQTFEKWTVFEEEKPAVLTSDGTHDIPTQSTTGLRTVQSDINTHMLQSQVTSTQQLSGESENDVQIPDAAFTSNTVVWDSVDVTRCRASSLPLEQFDQESLLNERNTIAMELLWIQQAIDSRKQYLHLRHEMSGSTS